MKHILALIVAVIGFASFANAQTDIRKVDFENFSFVIDKETIKMKAGLQENTCTKKDADGIVEGDVWNVVKESIAFGDLDGDGKEEAIVPMFAHVCSGNAVINEAVLVYTMKAGKPFQLPKFDYFDEGCVQGEKGCNFARTPAVSVSYDKTAKSIVITTNFSTDDDAICCPSLYRETLYKWNGSVFVEGKKGKLLKKEVEK
jgi:hypothetical protein